MNAEFRNHIATGGSIKVDILIDKIAVIAGDEPVTVDLSDKAMRRLLEHRPWSTRPQRARCSSIAKPRQQLRHDRFRLQLSPRCHQLFPLLERAL